MINESEYLHIGEDGKPTDRAIEQIFCDAERTIYVSEDPEDPGRRLVVVVPDHEKPHSHPTPIFSKTPHGVRNTYRRCVEAAGVIGATVARVDHGKLPSSGFKSDTNIFLSQQLLRHSNSSEVSSRRNSTLHWEAHG